MNVTLQKFARTQIKEMLSRCTKEMQMVFKRMYSHKDLTLDINSVVENMPEEKLDWAMQQCERTLEKYNL